MGLWQQSKLSTSMSHINQVFIIDMEIRALEVKKTLIQLENDKKIVSWEILNFKNSNPEYLNLKIAFNYKDKTFEFQEVIKLSSFPKGEINWERQICGFIKNRMRGIDAEDRMFNLVSSWKDQGLYNITGVHQCNSYEDNFLKADLIVQIERISFSFESRDKRTEQVELHIQIKSSAYHQQIHKEKHPWRVSIRINPDKTDEMLAEDFLSIIGPAIVVKELNYLLEILKTTDYSGFHALLRVRAGYLETLHK